MSSLTPVFKLHQQSPSVQTFRVRFEHLRLPPNPSSGLDPLRLMALVYHLACGNEDIEPPVEVIRAGPGYGWRIHCGRHRAIAAMIVGRPDVLCTEVLDDESVRRIA